MCGWAPPARVTPKTSRQLSRSVPPRRSGRSLRPRQTHRSVPAIADIYVNTVDFGDLPPTLRPATPRARPQGGADPMTSTADTVFVGGRVFTAPATDPVHAAVAVRGGRIAAVGPDDELRELVGTATEVVDLDGGLLVPGFQDAHVHPSWAASTAACDLHGATRRRVPRGGRAVRAGQPGPGVDQRRRLVDGGLPRRHPDQGARRRGPGPPGLPAEPRRARRLGEQQGARAGRDHAGDTRPGRRPDRAGRRRRAAGTLHEGAACWSPAAPERHRGSTSPGCCCAQQHLFSLGITAGRTPSSASCTAGRTSCTPTSAAAGDGRLAARVVGALWWDRSAAPSRSPSSSSGARTARPAGSAPPA